MLRSVQLTSADTSAHNLYGLILAKLGVTQLPQRVDQGAVFFPDFVASINFYINEGTLTIQDQSGDEVTIVPTSTNISLGAGNINALSLQQILIKSSVSGQLIDVAVFQI